MDLRFRLGGRPTLSADVVLVCVIGWTEYIYIYIYIYRYRLARAAIDRGEGDAGEGPVRKKTTRPACAVLYSQKTEYYVASMMNLPRQARDKSLLRL
jgi:hypothetical protein